ncbi:MAG: WD40 repeat domain-containing protein, partial [Hyphomonas sp.]
DGRLASGSEDCTIRLWDLASGAETGKLEGHDGWVNGLSVLPDGRLASGSEDCTIRLWDLASGAETGRLEGHEGAVLALQVLPDGRLVSGSSDKTIRLWDLANGAETARLELDDAASSLVALSGGRLVAGDGLGRLHWLAIKGEDAEVGRQSSFMQRAPLSPPGASQTLPRLMVQPTDPLAPAPTLSDTHPPGTKSAAELTGEPATKPPRKKQSAARLLFVLLALILVAALTVAAIFVGPAYGVPHARDAWEAALELLASWH